MNWYKKESNLNYKDFVDSNRGDQWGHILSLGKILGLNESQMDYLLKSANGDESVVIRKLEEHIENQLVAKRDREVSPYHQFPQNFDLRIAK